MPKKQYDYLIVGAGLFGAVFAHEAAKKGKRCLVLDRRNHIGGNLYTDEQHGVHVHQYGAHIFHTNNKAVWDYICGFADFNRFTNAPIAVWQDEVYNLPFNMNTFRALWGVKTPAEAKEKIARQIKESGVTKITNLEEQAISLVGTDIYEKLIKGYTEKQWGKSAWELPSFIIKRLPVRFTYDNNYFNDRYQGIPIGGYTQIIEKMLSEADVELNVDFLTDRENWASKADRVLFTGMIDAYYDYCFGELEYRSLRFENETLEQDNFQGCAVVNYTHRDIPYTRIIEHRHFDDSTAGEKTVVTKEYPAAWSRGLEPFYPINDEKNNALYQKYAQKAAGDPEVLFGGRLGGYQYQDMHQVIADALKTAASEL